MEDKYVIDKNTRLEELGITVKLYNELVKLRKTHKITLITVENLVQYNSNYFLDKLSTKSFLELSRILKKLQQLPVEVNDGDIMDKIRKLYNIIFTAENEIKNLKKQLFFN